MKKYFALGCVAMVAIVVPALSFAASMNAGSKVSVEGTTVAQGNAYAAGGTVNVFGSINGDLLAAGGTVLSSAKVNGDIMAAGGTITMVGVSAQDVRIAGGNVTVGGAVAGELVAAGGQLTVNPETTIVKDSYLYGGSVSFLGSEAGNLKIYGGDVYFDGTVGGNLTLDRAGKVTIGPHALIKGTFEYSAPVAASIDSGAKISGAPIFHQIPDNQKNGGSWTAMSGVFTLLWFLKFFAILTASYLLWYLFRGDSLAVIDQSRSHYGRSLLRGFIFFIVMPVSAIIGFITVIGAIPALIALLAYFALLALAAPFTVLFVAALLRKGPADMHWYHILFSAVVVGIVGTLPFIGWIAYALAYLAVLGAVANVFRGKFA